jgi:hypothetical protein
VALDDHGDGRRCVDTARDVGAQRPRGGRAGVEGLADRDAGLDHLVSAGDGLGRQAVDVAARRHGDHGGLLDHAPGVVGEHRVGRQREAVGRVARRHRPDAGDRDADHERRGHHQRPPTLASVHRRERRAGRVVAMRARLTT